MLVILIEGLFNILYKFLLLLALSFLIYIEVY